MKRYLYNHANSSMNFNRQKGEATQVSTDKQMDWKTGYIHTMEYYSAWKNMEILIHATTWMNIEDIMISEISQSQKDK